MTKIITLFLIIVNSFVLTCFAEINTDNDNDSRKVYLNNIAEYLAGIKGGNSDHINLMDELWSKYKYDNLDKLHAWQEKEIEHTYPKSCHVFYPFSGPDIVHVLSFFPSCTKYTMIGLEPVGNINNLDISKINLEALRTGLYSLLKKSFFVTREMWTDFKLHNRGVTLPLIALVKRMGYEIVEVNPIYLDKEGNIINVIQGHNNGIKFTIKAPDNEEFKEIYYFRASVANNNDTIINYLENQTDIITYLKAAQYALFSAEFSKLRNHILKKSQIILQDDSGIPYKYFNNSNWQVNLYGKYSGPYGESFKGYIQPDLSNHLKNVKFETLPFSLGYGYKKTTTFLMKMVKKQHNTISDL
ncbi:MAG: hypothetical protein ACK4OM_01770 [Alphaproteobacteria bacterium]